MIGAQMKKETGAGTPVSENSTVITLVGDDTERGENSVFAIRAQRLALQNELLKWALAYADRGIPVFPCRGNKKPLVKWSKGVDQHPDLTKRRATSDSVTVRAWWKRWPLAMIGVPTGSTSGFCVVDVDCKNGVDGFASLQAIGGLPADAVGVRTPSGGAHFWFRLPAGQVIKNSASKIGPGIDIRGEGGFAIVPPSRPRPDGDDYCYMSPREMGSLA